MDGKLSGWEFSDVEEDRVAAAISPLLRRKILKNLGSRQLSQNDLDELSYYWTASLVDSVPLWGRIPKDRFLSMAPQEMLFSFCKDGKWERGIGQYSETAGESLIDTIGAKINSVQTVRLLDIGCGDAYFLREVKDRYANQVNCVGVSNRIFPDIKILDGVLKMSTLAEVLPQSFSNNFDLITCFNASFYFYDRQRAFNEALRSLSQQGVLFFGHGGLKTLGNDSLLERLMRVQDFEYKFKTGDSEEQYSGIFAKWLSKLSPFEDYVDYLKNNNGGIFDLFGKRFHVEADRHTHGWDGVVLKVTAQEKKYGR